MLHPDLTRRAASSVLLLPLLTTPAGLRAHAAVKFEGGAEAAQRAAALLPGYGPPDALYPAAFRGRWRVVVQVVDVRTPQGEESAPAAQLRAARTAAAAAAPFVFDARFLNAEGSGGVILQSEGSASLATRPVAGRVRADRGFNTEQRAAAQVGSARPVAQWEAGSPNVLTLTDGLGGVREVKIIKRLVEEPYDGAYGVSEFARYTAATSAGDLKSSPSVFAQRVQTKYKWEPGRPSQPATRIEAFEIAVLASGFGDPAGAVPLLVVKSRLTFTRSS